MNDNSKITVLIVDDETSIRESLSEYLRDYDFTVISCKDAAEAAEEFKKSKIDVGIIDMRLPGMSGDSLILSASRIQPETKFIIHTGSVSYSISDELSALGLKPENILLKPQINLKNFVDTIKKIL